MRCKRAWKLRQRCFWPVYRTCRPNYFTFLYDTGQKKQKLFQNLWKLNILCSRAGGREASIILLAVVFHFQWRPWRSDKARSRPATRSNKVVIREAGLVVTLTTRAPSSHLTLSYPSPFKKHLPLFVSLFCPVLTGALISVTRTWQLSASPFIRVCWGSNSH